MVGETLRLCTQQGEGWEAGHMVGGPTVLPRHFGNPALCRSLNEMPFLPCCSTQAPEHTPGSAVPCCTQLRLCSPPMWGLQEGCSSPGGGPGPLHSAARLSGELIASETACGWAAWAAWCLAGCLAAFRPPAARPASSMPHALCLDTPLLLCCLHRGPRPGTKSIAHPMVHSKPPLLKSLS
jgi:hypothetical protein